MRAPITWSVGTKDSMRTFIDAKAMATTLRDRLAAQGTEVSHSTALELVAAQFGLADWNVLAAKIARRVVGGIQFEQGVAVLRIFDVVKAEEFYQGFLGFETDWEHRFGDNYPVYRQISRAGTVLHLSEHHGDANPGSTVWIQTHGLEMFHRELRSADYRYAKPGIERDDWGMTVEVSDPFGNRLRFCEKFES